MAEDTDAMSTEDDGPRVSGEAAWKAHRDELERRNAATKRRAHDLADRRDLAVSGREQRLARVEEVQLQRLNERIADNRAPGG